MQNKNSINSASGIPNMDSFSLSFAFSLYHINGNRKMTTDRRIIGFCKPSQPFRLQQGKTNDSSLNFSRGQVEHTTHTHSLSLSCP